MQKILLLLNNHPFVTRYVYNSPPTAPGYTFYEMTIYFSDEIRKYSYHWQDLDKNLLIRWDTAPHHKHLSTFPHHKHDPEPSPSDEITLEEVLQVIFSKITS